MQLHGNARVWKYDRFARQLDDHIALRGALASHRTQLASITEPTSKDPTGQLLENILASFAQFDNDLRAQRTRLGMAAAAASGRWITKPPIGEGGGSFSEQRGDSWTMLTQPDRPSLCFRGHDRYS